MAKITPKPGVILERDGPTLTADADGWLVRRDTPLTAADVRHRLETWPVMLDALRYAHREMSADRGGGLAPITAALAAAEEQPR